MMRLALIDESGRTLEVHELTEDQRMDAEILAEVLTADLLAYTQGRYDIGEPLDMYSTESDSDSLAS